MKLKHSLPVQALVAFSLLSCNRPKEMTRPDDTDTLYKESVALAREFTDSIRTAPDSVAALRAFASFGTRLDSLNYALAPDTDLLLTEGENDTLFMEITAVRTELEQRLKYFKDKGNGEGCNEFGNDTED